MSEYEEKRAEALEDMGLELEDIRNKERFRLAVLQNMNGSGGSGGGSSDLAVYKVNIVNNTSTNISGIQAYKGVGLDGNGEPVEIIDTNIGVLANKNNEIGILVFLKSEEPFGGIIFSSSVNATCTGGVAPMEGMEGQAFNVTSDGTITIS